MTTLPRKRFIDPRDAFWVNSYLHSSVPAEIAMALIQLYPWLKGISCVCPYCKVAQVEEIPKSIES
jgi:hypothetical protein